MWKSGFDRPVRTLEGADNSHIILPFTYSYKHENIRDTYVIPRKLFAMDGEFVVLSECSNL